MAAPQINDLDLQNEFVEVPDSASAEEFFQPPLPDDGDHLAILRLGQDGITAQRQKSKSTGKRDGTAFLMVHLALKLLDDQGKETMTVFDRPTSIPMQSGMSRLHAILEMSGNPIPGRSSLADLKAHVERVLAQATQVKVTTRWEAQINRGTKEAPDYETLLKGQARFATINGTGKHDPEATDPKSGEKVRAQAQVIKYSRP